MEKTSLCYGSTVASMHTYVSFILNKYNSTNININWFGEVLKSSLQVSAYTLYVKLQIIASVYLCRRTPVLIVPPSDFGLAWRSCWKLQVFIQAVFFWVMTQEEKRLESFDASTKSKGMNWTLQHLHQLLTFVLDDFFPSCVSGEISITTIVGGSIKLCKDYHEKIQIFEIYMVSFFPPSCKQAPNKHLRLNGSWNSTMSNSQIQVSEKLTLTAFVYIFYDRSDILFRPLTALTRNAVYWK